MKLYHGTALVKLPSIMERGIIPRSMLKTKGNWKHSVISNPDAVYLTNCYAWHFAGSAGNGMSDKGVILEIDRDRLDMFKFRPDEDFLEQSTRNQSGPNMADPAWDMKKRTMYYRRIAKFNPHLSELSLENMGTIGYYGIVPWRAVTRYVEIDWKKMHDALMIQAFDSMVSVMNYRVLQDRHRAFTRWFFGDDVDVHDVSGVARIGEFEVPDEKGVFNVSTQFTDMMTRQLATWTEAMSQRDGLNVVSLEECPLCHQQKNAHHHACDETNVV